jgi:hypothetical protein
MLPTPICNPSGGQSNPRLKAKGVIYPAMGPLLAIAAGEMEPGRYRGDMEGRAMLPTPMASGGMKDGAGGGAGSTYPFRKILATPRATDGQRGGRGDVLSQLRGYPSKHAGMLPTPVAGNSGSNRSLLNGERAGPNRPNVKTLINQAARETLPTPLKSDRNGSLGRMSNGKQKFPNMPLVLGDAMTGRAADKWAYAREIAALLTAHGLSGASMTLPIVYEWMMGYPPGWLRRALLSAVQEGHLPQVSSSKPTATASSRKSRKP